MIMMQEAANKKRVYLGVLRIAIWETQIQVKPKECSKEVRESRLIKTKSNKVVKIA